MKVRVQEGNVTTEEEGGRRTCDGKRRGSEQRKIQRCYTAGFEGGKRSHKPRNTGALQKLAKARKWILP